MYSSLRNSKISIIVPVTDTSKLSTNQISHNIVIRFSPRNRYTTVHIHRIITHHRSLFQLSHRNDRASKHTSMEEPSSSNFISRAFAIRKRGEAAVSSTRFCLSIYTSQAPFRGKGSRKWILEWHRFAACVFYRAARTAARKFLEWQPCHPRNSAIPSRPSFESNITAKSGHWVSRWLRFVR